MQVCEPYELHVPCHNAYAECQQPNVAYENWNTNLHSRECQQPNVAYENWNTNLHSREFCY